MPWLMLIAALFVLSTPVDADEFADVDPERLAKGIDILAAKWTIPTVVFHGATDDFAKSGLDGNDNIGAASGFPVISRHAEPAGACPGDDGTLRDRRRYGGIADCLSGAITRRRE